MIILLDLENSQGSSINTKQLQQILKRIFFKKYKGFFLNDSKSEKSEEERENEELRKKVDLIFRKVKHWDTDLKYELFDEKKLKDLERWYTDKQLLIDPQFHQTP